MGMNATADAGVSTMVSYPGAGAGLVGPPGAPGAGGPGAQMSMASALLWVVGGAAAVTVGVGFLARKGVKPEIGRFDVVDVVFTSAGVAVVFGTLNALAYSFHGHKVAQAWLLLH